MKNDIYLNYDHQTGQWCVSDSPPKVIRTGSEVIHARVVTRDLYGDGNFKKDPDHIAFRKKVLEEAYNLRGEDFVGEFNSGGEEVEDYAKQIAIILAAYDFTISEDNHLMALVAGDQGWADTGIVVDRHD